MRRLLTVICTLLLSASVSGQQIKSRPVGFDDFRSLLEAAGYEAFGFDLSELLEGPGRYDMTVYIKEYESGVEIRSREFPCGPNKLLVSDFPEKVRGEILPGEMADPQAGIYMLAKKLTIGFYPSGTDSTAMLNFSIPEMREASQRLKLRIEPHRTVKDQRNELSGLERVDPERTGAVLGLSLIHISEPTRRS